MPFTALRQGDRVIPHQVEGDQSLICPRCDDEMVLVQSHHRKNGFVASHFRHLNNDDCGGESTPHREMKSIAYSKLKSEFPEAEISFEKGLENRRPDVLVEFNHDRFPEGHGIAVEVQHRNNSKDLFKTDQDYFDMGYSVLWLSEQHYSEKDVEIDHVDTVWPAAIPQLKGDNSLSWPVCEKETPETYSVRLPPDYLYKYRGDFKAGFERGQQRQPVSRWENVEKVWLSPRSATTVRSLDLSRSPTDDYYLKLSKGKRGEKPETVHIPISKSDLERIEKIPSKIEASINEAQESEEWEDLETLWLKPYEVPLKAWLTVKSSPDGNYVLVLGRKNPNGESENVPVAIHPTENLVERVTDFIESIREEI